MTGAGMHAKRSEIDIEAAISTILVIFDLTLLGILAYTTYPCKTYVLISVGVLVLLFGLYGFIGERHMRAANPVYTLPLFFLLLGTIILVSVTDVCSIAASYF